MNKGIKKISPIFRCPFTSVNKNGIARHVLIHFTENSKEHCCDLCGRIFQKRFELNRHFKNKHTEKEKKHKCTFEGCDKGEKNFKCFS